MTKEMKDEKGSGWFHCGRCGALFGAELGGAVHAACPECGRDPVVEPSELAFAGAAGAPSLSRSREESGEGRRRRDREEKERSGLFVIVMIWALVLVLFAVGAKFLRGSKEVEEDLGFEVISEDQRLVSEQYNECKRKVGEFLSAAAPENRVEFVLNPAETLRRIAGGQTEVAGLEEETELGDAAVKVIETPRGKAIETIWELEGTRRLEAVFFKDDGGEWKIDWANLVRYSEREWPLFLVGDGVEEAEFRLLARRRAEDPTGQGKVSSIVLVGPRPGYPGELGASSPEVTVDPDSRIGRLLAAAFAKRDADEGVYGSDAAVHDPNGMIRLRAKVIREGEVEGRKVFAIREIMACHWYDFDDLGL